MDELKEYLRQELSGLCLDTDTYLEHLLQLLYYTAEQGGDTTTLIAFLQECGLSEEDSYDVSSRIYEAYVTAWWAASQQGYDDADGYEFYGSTGHGQLGDGELQGDCDKTTTIDVEAIIGPPPGLIPNKLLTKDDGTETIREGGIEYPAWDAEPFEESEFYGEGEDDTADNNDNFDLMVMVDLVEEILKSEHKWEQEFPPEVLFLALNKANCDVEDTAQVLMHNADTLVQCKPCRHMMQSRCVRSDCYFDHDLSRIPCKFWLYYGSCESSTEECFFMHDLADIPPDSQRKASATYYAPVKLKSSSDASSASTAWPKLSSDVDTDKKTQNISGFKSAINRVPIQSSGDSWDCADSQTTSHYTRRSGYGTYGCASSLKESLFEAGFISKQSLKEHQYHQYNVDQEISVSAAAYWKSGGDSLRKTYLQLREDAATLAKARNHYLQQATQAYLMNDRSTARQFSKQGQSHNAQMKAAHREAALVLFQHRNSNLSQLCDQGIIDLHGLHIAEAQEILSEIIPMFLYHFGNTPGLMQKPIRVFTGSGHHSVVYGHRRPRLLPAVQKEITEILEHARQDKSYIGGRKVIWKQQEIRDNNGFVSGVMLSH